MAITFSNSYASASYTSLNMILTQAFTVPANTKELLIFVYVDNSNTSAPAPDLVRYGGVNATLVSAIPVDAGGTGQLHFFYRILNPTAGTANLEVRHPTIGFGAAATCLLVDQNYILTYSAYSYANTASPSVSIASESGNKTLYSFVANNIAGTSLSETGGQTVLVEGGTISNATHQLSEEVSAGTTNSATWTISGGAQRTSAIAINVKEISQTLTIGSDLVPSASRTDTCTGFADGAATISFSGVSVGVTIASGSFTWTVPMLADGVTWPRLPATSRTITLTQSALSATASANINLPTGHQTLRVGDVIGGAVANFSGVITDNQRMLGYHFLAAANPLTNDYTAYFVTSDNYWVYRNGDVGADTASLPRTDVLYVQDTTTGVVSSHSVTLSPAGVVVEDTTPNSFTFTAVTNANVNTSYISNEVTITGLGTGVAATLTVANGTYSKNGSAFTSSAGVISNGDTLRVRRNSSSSYNTAVTASVTVGTYTTSYSITTKVDNDPDNIKFVTLSALSNVETIEGVVGSVPISITGGQYSKNSGAFTATAGTVVNTDTIQLSAANGSTVRVTIGGKTFSWSSKGGGGGFGGSIGIGI